VSENGTVLNHFVYDGFGTRTGSTTAEFRYGYTGRELDAETGLYYYRARYYDSKVGRFISEDPIGFSAGDTNLYRYVGNNSTNYTDPTGELAFFLPLLGIMALGGLFGAATNVIQQNLKIIEGSQERFELGQFASSAVLGSILAPIFIVAPELAVPASIFGVAEGVKSISEGRILSGSFDIISSVLPFASKGGRKEIFGRQSFIQSL
jgi:RHS repeat-associated protein